MTYPHCDPRVLHAPRECRYCDMHPLWQIKRMVKGINFTGHYDPDKEICPSEQARPLDLINRWPGNIPQPIGAPIHTIFGDIPDSEYDNE